MITFTVQHILILRTLIQYEIPSTTALQCIYFLASAQSNQREEVGFYDFIRSLSGLSSNLISKIITTFENNDIIHRKSLTLTKEGYEIYYQLCAALKNNDVYIKRIDDICNRFNPLTEKALLQEVRKQIIFHRCRPGFYIFPKVQNPKT